jgi:uncharacterized OsmC-like protein
MPELYTGGYPHLPPPSAVCIPGGRRKRVALIDRASLRANHAAVVERLQTDPAFGLMHPAVTARLVRDVSVESSFVQYDRPFTFLGDEAADRGGHETGPSPMRYFLTGIAFCLLGWWAKGAALLDVEIDSLAVTMRAFLDMRGEHAVGDLPANPQNLILDVAVSGPAAHDRVLEVIDWGIRYCPLAALVGSAIPVLQRVVHDGTVIRDIAPAAIAEG